MKRHVKCFVGKAGFEPRTLGTKVERYDHCATRQVMLSNKLNPPIRRTVSVPDQVKDEAVAHVVVAYCLIISSSVAA